MALFVNEEEVTQAQIEVSKAQLQQMPDFEPSATDPEEIEEEVTGKARENAITGILINQEVARQKIEVPEEDVDAVFENLRKEHAGAGSDIPEEHVKAAKENIKIQIKIDKLLDQVCKDMPEPSEDEIKACYDENKDYFTEPESVHAMHIVKHAAENVIDRNAAQNALAEILKEIEGGETFEDVANKNSDCPGQGVDLGFFSRGEMVPEFEDVVFNMEEGEISGIFHTTYGLHIAKVCEKRPEKIYPFEEAKEAVKQKLRTDKENVHIDKFIEELRSKAVIEEK